MLFLSAAAGRGNQAEDDGLANKKLLYFCEIILSTIFQYVSQTLATRRDAKTFEVLSSQP